MEPGQAAQLVWEGKQNGVYYPDPLRAKISPADGYQVQLEVLALEIAAGEAQAGWKVGLTSKATQEQIGIFERVFGYLLKSGELRSGVALDFGALTNPLFENELCLILGKPLRGPGVTVKEARSAIQGIAPAIELVERRGNPIEDPGLSLADNAEHKYFITGSVVTPLDPRIDLKKTVVEIYINGDRVQRASGQEVLDGAEGSVAWLANKLSNFGLGLEPGDKIMSGSFTRQHPVKPGSRIEAVFDPFGSVSFECR